MIRLYRHTLSKFLSNPSIGPNCYKRQYRASRIIMNDASIDHHNPSLRDFIVDVLNTNPSKREAMSYINRFSMPKPGPPPPIPVNTEKPTSPVSKKDVQQDLINPRKENFVDSLFETKFEHIALIKIQGPLTSLDLKSVAKTLVRLQNLGLMPITILDNEEWSDMLNGGPCRFNELRKWMVEESTNFCQALEGVGGRAIPIYNGVFTLTHDGQSKECNKNNQLRTLSTDADAKINVSSPWLESSLKLGHIPLIIPIALDGLSMQRTIHPNAGMIALSRFLSNPSNTECLDLKTPYLEPMKIVVISPEGGIPSEERKGSHVLINIQQEYEDIKRSYKDNPLWNLTHKTSLANFEMIKTCLENLPSTSSAIMAPAYFPTVLIYNLITDKPPISSSLPKPTSTTTTLIRHGMQVLHHNSLSTVDIPSLKSLIENSFDKKLDFDNYISRLEKCLDLIIITGDYQGAAIVTMEDNNKRGYVPYLDKFAVLPNNRGTGIADILWKQLQIKYPNLLWRSRGNNGVNKWYFERSDGNYRIPGSEWIMFWYGRDGTNKMATYTETARTIPASFYTKNT